MESPCRVWHAVLCVRDTARELQRLSETHGRVRTQRVDVVNSIRTLARKHDLFDVCTARLLRGGRVRFAKPSVAPRLSPTLGSQRVLLRGHLPLGKILRV